MNRRNYDRSGRLNIEQFHVVPPGRDPLQSYYSVGAFFMGGLGSERVLSSEPEIMREDLNEWSDRRSIVLHCDRESDQPNRR